MGIVNPALEKKKVWIDKYKAAYATKYAGRGLTEPQLTALASGTFDALTQAGGKAIPTMISYVLGYIVTHNKPGALLTPSGTAIDLTDDTNLKNLIWECLRMHPPVSA